jgi:hypothetical protein
LRLFPVWQQPNQCYMDGTGGPAFTTPTRLH